MPDPAFPEAPEEKDFAQEISRARLELGRQRQRVEDTTKVLDHMEVLLSSLPPDPEQQKLWTYNLIMAVRGLTEARVFYNQAKQILDKKVEDLKLKDNPSHEKIIQLEADLLEVEQEMQVQRDRQSALEDRLNALRSKDI